ncbi:hypothetical protein D8I35_08350 [Corticibacter populi]|uniref:Uncharacterized protein n=1 Tax=Corticibacter populi TaxID=1550736 RepID=A0A3M6QU14_9BURK|nr:hypothetical protein [Corticibacter populi]RMX06524.1 hypothetical protein D8I35_08350 [Corticibacter populi]RZS31914.1 hypothetical protein EV687_2594 [Corticibacter populi]
MTPSLAFLNFGGGDGPPALTGGHPPRVTNLRLYDLETLPGDALQQWRAILVPCHVDQRFLQSRRPHLERYLLNGGTLVVNGHVAYPFLCWLQPFEAAPALGLEGLRVHRAAPHPIFAGVDAEHMTFRRGVAGFYARGANPVPHGALVLNTLGPERLPIDWLLELPGGGRLLVHSGNDLWMFAGGHDSAARILPQLLDWLEEERK